MCVRACLPAYTMRLFVWVLCPLALSSPETGFLTARTVVRDVHTSELRNIHDHQDFDYKRHGQDWVHGYCAGGQSQSPIDFSRSAAWNRAPSGSFFAKYQPIEGFKFEHDGHSIHADFAFQGYGGMTFRGKLYSLHSMKFHVHSEHTFRGHRFPAEIHLVHEKDDGGGLTIIALPVDLGAADQTLAALLKTRMPQVKEVLHRHGPLNLNALVQDKHFFMYRGSLTVPPCSEIVDWFVLRKPMTMSEEQLTVLRNATYDGTHGYNNYRTTMPLNGREVDIALCQIGEPAEEPSKYPAILPKVRAGEFRGIRKGRAAAEEAGKLQSMWCANCDQEDDPKKWLQKVADTVAEQEKAKATETVIQAKKDIDAKSALLKGPP